MGPWREFVCACLGEGGGSQSLKLGLRACPTSGEGASPLRSCFSTRAGPLCHDPGHGGPSPDLSPSSPGKKRGPHGPSPSAPGRRREDLAGLTCPRSVHVLIGRCRAESSRSKNSQIQHLVCWCGTRHVTRTRPCGLGSLFCGFTLMCEHINRARHEGDFPSAPGSLRLGAEIRQQGDNLQAAFWVGGSLSCLRCIFPPSQFTPRSPKPTSKSI